MHFGFLIIGIITCYIWTYKCTGAIPTVTLTASSSPYFDIGGSISLTCSISEDVGIKYVYLTKDGINYVYIIINNASSCVYYKWQPSVDLHSYSVTCEQRMTVHIVMNGTVASDNNTVWGCQMSAESGICNTNSQSCTSTSSVTIVQRVPVSSVQLRDGTGQLLVTPVPVPDGSSKVFRCDTSPNGSRPHALFNWYKRSENQSPILIQDQSVSTPRPKPEVDLSVSISYSTLTLMGSRSYQNMYIYCEARDETNRGNFLKSTEAQLNIVYPPVVQLLPNKSVCNVTEGSPKFEFICNVTDANPIPQPDDYSWFHGGSVVQGQTRSSYELLNVQKSQDGTYHCMARNNYGSGNSSTMDLNVHYGPTISLIDYIEVEEGENVSIACNVTANPQPDIVWSRNGTVILPSSNTLRIPYISRLNEGNYTCTASNVLYPTGQVPVPQMAVDTIRISVFYGPGNSSYLIPNISMYGVEEGKKADDIVCRATCNPACSYRWLKGNIQINSSNTLSLGNVQKNMTGNYTCEAFNTIREHRRGSNISVEVIIKYVPIVKLQAQGKDSNPYILKEGHQNVVLECKVVDANPQPTLFVWTHNGVIKQGESKSTFSIPVATRQTNGTWGCKGFNSYGTPLESQLQVDVQYGPVIEPIKNETVIEGKMFSVNCKVDSNPLPVSVSWTKDNNATFSYNASVLTVDSVSRYDNGTYRCTAVNRINPSGQNVEYINQSEGFYLNVQYGAEIINISVSEGNTVNENNTATIICLVDSNPESNVTWTKQGIMGNLQTNVSVRTSRLIFENAGCLDTANYTCNAGNGLGDPVEKTVPLYVTCHPRTDFRSPPVTKVYSNWHGNASLNYTVISFPEPRFNWTFIGNGSENRSLPDSAMKHDSGLQSVLMFNNLNIIDFGFYKVIAENMFPPSVTEVFQLIPAGAPEVPSNVTVTDVKQTSLTVQWVAGYDGGLKQTFHIMITASDITRSVYASDPGYGKLGTQTIEDLIPNTEYSISMSANNSLYSSNVTNAIIRITLKVPDTSPSPISAIAGGVAAGIVTILLVGIGIILWRRYQHNKSVDGLVDNPVYDSSDVNPGQLVEYASVDKSKKRTSQTEDLSNVYAQVDKTTKSGQNRAVKGKHGKNSKGEIYENATLHGRSTNKEDIYENPGNSLAETCENVYENPGTSKSNGTLMNKDGLLYADLMLIPPTTKNGKPVILGLENRTVYAEIAYGKRGELLPDKEKEHGSSTNEPREK